MPQVLQAIEALVAEGIRHQQAENFDAAERAYRAALQLDPTHSQALALLGMLAGMSGDFQAAIDLFLKALQRDPNNADLYHNLGETYRHLGEPAKALPCFAKAVELRPGLLVAYRSAADAAVAASGKADTPDQARQLKAVAQHYARGLGKRLREAKHAEAPAVLREALAINPFDVETLRELGDCAYDYGLPSEAAAMFRRALALDPRNAGTFSRLGIALFQVRQWDAADDAFEAALRVDPAHKIARANRVTCHLMHWLYEDAPAPDEVYRHHRAWGERITAELAATAAAEAAPFRNSRDPERRLRVAFISGDFRDHPVARFFGPLLEHHDRSALDVYCYTETERTSADTTALRQLGGTWRIASVRESDAALRAQLRADAIDIAIDLSGHTAGTRLSALAVRATPVAATWLGYPATTGLPTIDWRITDELADPPGYERFCTERLLRLPDGFLCYQPQAAPAVTPPPLMTQCAITFGSFNNALKLTPATVRCWAAILAAVPRARLVLKASTLTDPAVRSALIEQFSAAGIDGTRIDLRPPLADAAAHMAAYGEIDIGLDPLVYNGTTTTCEALWMGVPVLALIGDRHAARVGYDLLSRVGLADLATTDRDSYVALAVQLATNLPRLQQLRSELRERMRRSPLCDAPRFTRQFEAGLRAMWRDWCVQRIS